jgi:hypothetical protein
MRLVAAALATLLVAGLVSACSSLPGSYESQAAALAADKAERAHRAVDLAPGNPPLENMARIVSAHGDVLSAEGDQRRGGATIVLRTTGEVSSPGGLVSETRCFRLTFRKDSRGWDQSTRGVDCPEGGPIDLPPATEPPRLPIGAADIVRMTLEPFLGSAADRDRITAALEEALPGARITVEVAGDTIGVAGLVAGPMLRDCVYARVTAAGVEAWTPPHVYEQAGETSCDGVEALSDFTRHSPH